MIRRQGRGGGEKREEEAKWGGGEEAKEDHSTCSSSSSSSNISSSGEKGAGVWGACATHVGTAICYFRIARCFRFWISKWSNMRAENWNFMNMMHCAHIICRSYIRYVGCGDGAEKIKKIWEWCTALTYPWPELPHTDVGSWIVDMEESFGS